MKTLERRCNKFNTIQIKYLLKTLNKCHARRVEEIVLIKGYGEA